VRMSRYHRFGLGLFLVVLIGPVVFSQPGPFGPPGGGGPPGGPGMDGGRGMRGGGFFARPDPEEFWKQISGGRDSFNIKEAQFPPQMAFFKDRIIERWDKQLKDRGITNGVMTKAIYDEMNAEMRQRMQRGGFGAFGGPPGGPLGGTPSAPPASPPGGTPPAPSSNPASEDSRLEEEARRFFAFLDRNRDGFLDKEEASNSQALRDFDRFDRNKDGKISPDEYVEAYLEQQAARGRGSRAASRSGSSEGNLGRPTLIPQDTPRPLDDARPTVYRTGKMPKDLPSWFDESDTDKDAQIGLYEWKAAGKSWREFIAIDANEDGFLTVEEVLRHQKAQNKDTTGLTFAAFSNTSAVPGIPPSSESRPSLMTPRGEEPRREETRRFPESKRGRMGGNGFTNPRERGNDRNGGPGGFMSKRGNRNQ